LEKCLITDTETQSLQEDLKEFMALLPADKFLEITLDYLANDPEFNEAYAHVQSEQFPRIHKIAEYLKQYKDVSNFMCMFIKCQSVRENICSVSTGV
jgi:hypothetical protein